MKIGCGIFVVLMLSVCYADPTAIEKDKKWNKYLTEIHSEILKQLNMKEPPVKRLHPKKHVMPRYLMEKHVDERNKAQIIIAADKVSSVGEVTTLKFKTKSLKASQSIIQTRVSIYKKLGLSKKFVTVLLKHNGGVISSTSARDNYDGWLYFDITPISKDWMEVQRKATFELQVQGKLLVETTTEYVPHILIRVEDSASSTVRARRAKSSGKSWECHANATCCAFPKYVDFTKGSGWDFIVAPRGFWTKTCLGKCPGKILGSENQQCCVPIKKGPITIYHVNSNDHLYSKSMNIVNLECGCL